MRTSKEKKNPLHSMTPPIPNISKSKSSNRCNDEDANHRHAISTNLVRDVFQKIVSKKKHPITSPKIFKQKKIDHTRKKYSEFLKYVFPNIPQKI